MVTTQDLTFSYGTETTFRFPDIFCSAKEAMLITGGSGKGKTTLLHLLGGLLRPDSGEINIDFTDIAKLSEKELDRFRGKNIGIILQEPHFVESLSVLENVSLAAWLATGRKSEKKAKELLDHLGLSTQIAKHPSQLSIGQQQRVSIARALINKPKLLLCDEPTSSLDDQNAWKVATMLADLSEEFAAALIIVTHDQRLKDRFPKNISL